MKTQNNKKIIIGLLALVVIVAAMIIVTQLGRPETHAGDKDIRITVISSDGSEVSYEVHTDAEFLQQAMDEADGLEYSGEDSDFGFMIDTINGELASFEENGAFWGIFINGDFATYGISQQPVTDGDHFEFVYTAGD